MDSSDLFSKLRPKKKGSLSQLPVSIAFKIQIYRISFSFFRFLRDFYFFSSFFPPTNGKKLKKGREAAAKKKKQWPKNAIKKKKRVFPHLRSPFWLKKKKSIVLTALTFRKLRQKGFVFFWSYESLIKSNVIFYHLKNNARICNNQMFNAKKK